MKTLNRRAYTCQELKLKNAPKAASNEKIKHGGRKEAPCPEG